jgi:iron complex outermembrane receptor protein
LASNTSTVAKAFGIEPLKEETAQNFAAGFTFNKGGFTATVDGYMIDVDDRIILTDIFDASHLNVGAEAAQFFANGVDTRTTGVDIVLGYRRYLNNGSLTASIAGNFNNTEIRNVNSGNLNRFTFFGPFSQAYLEAAAPDYKFAFNVGANFGKLDAFVTWTQFSEVLLQDFQWVDSPATNQAEADALYAVATDTYESAGTLDISVGYQSINCMGMNRLPATGSTAASHTAFGPSLALDHCAAAPAAKPAARMKKRSRAGFIVLRQTRQVDGAEDPAGPSG